MKITFFDFTTMIGGATKGSIYLLQRLRDRGVDVGVIDVYGSCQEHIAEVKDNHIPFDILHPKAKNTVIGFNHNFYKRLISIFSQIPAFIKILLSLFVVLKNRKTNFILINNEKSLLFVALLKKILGYKIILYYRGEAKTEQISALFTKLINTSVDIIYCHSKIAIINLKELGIKKDIIYLPNCIPTSKLLQLGTHQRNNNEFKVFLCSGRVVEEKGYHTAIEAIKILNDRNIKIKMFFPGLIVDEIYFNKLKEFIKNNALNNQVEFCGWIDDIPASLIEMDCMVLPSYTEGFPRSIIEAMLLKVVVCATPVGGIPEAITNGKTGYIFDVNNSLELANYLNILIQDKVNYDLIAQSAFDFAISHFDERVNTDIFITGLNRI